MKPTHITEEEVAEIERLCKELLAKLSACEHKELGNYWLRLGKVFNAMEHYRNG